MHPGHGAAKSVSRAAVRERRRARGPVESVAVADGLAARADDLLACLDRWNGAVAEAPVDRPGSRVRAVVAVYLSLPGEPGTAGLRERLDEAGATVLLPWLQDDMDLDWVRDTRAATDLGTGAGTSTGAGLGTGTTAAMRPAGRRLGPDAVVGADAVLVPALAVDAAGTRLGQGGGSYDRSLSRLPTARRALVLAVVHEDELWPPGQLPRQPHDVPVDGALTPAGITLFRDASPAARARPRRPPRA